MEPELLRIKCPNCGAVLTIKNMLGLETKNIPCPVCKKVSKYTEYKIPKPTSSSPSGDDTTSFGDATQIKTPNKQWSIGKLLNAGTNEEYKLVPGMNVIGRKAQSSNATIQINTDDRSMSRSHSIIEVRTLKTGGYARYFSNAENKNATYINSQLVENGDKIILRGGETIKMANTTLRFVIDSEEETTL